MSTQLGFDALLAAADTSNRQQHEQRAYAHLPVTMEEGESYFRTLIQRHHEAMLKGDAKEVARLRDEAHNLAYKLNGFEPGILAGDDAPGCVLAKLTRAPDGQVPLWGQEGTFEIRHRDMRVRIEMEGMFGIGATAMAWMGFGANAVDVDRPFLSETGYRSFLGCGGALEPGYTPDTFAAAIVRSYVDRQLKGRLRKITPIAAKGKNAH